MGTNTKIRIGFIVTNDDVGAVYYLRSVVKAVGTLPENSRPQLVLFYSENCKKYLELFDYDYVQSIRIQLPHIVIQYLRFIFTKKNRFIQDLAQTNRIDGFFPLNEFPTKGNKTFKSISWIPDFQHKFYPALFKKKNLILREKRFKLIIEHTDALVLSSNDAYSHLQSYYTLPSDLKVHILPFVSMIKDHSLSPLKEILSKYQIANPYFLVSNQFYEHKNHLAVLNALRSIKKKEATLTIVFTGKSEDYRNPDFYPYLLNRITDWGLESYVKILGLIPRDEQLSLMKGAISIVQPSKFEGWSTSVEDAKTLGVQVICSDLAVHKEQMGDRAFYFPSDEPEILAELLMMLKDSPEIRKPLFNDYEERVTTFANKFVEIFNN